MLNKKIFLFNFLVAISAIQIGFAFTLSDEAYFGGNYRAERSNSLGMPDPFSRKSNKKPERKKTNQRSLKRWKAVREEEEDYDTLLFSEPSAFYISLGHTDGKGIGYDEGYTTLKGAVFFPNAEKKIFPFIDLRYHFLNNGQSALNAGAGIRFVPSFTSKIFGFNVFYDYRRSPAHCNCQQMGVGAELLSRLMEFRINGYFPLKKLHMVHYCYYDGYEGPYFIARKQYEYVFPGVDAEAGYRFFRNQKFLLYGALGTYYLVKNSCIPTVVGAKIRFECIVRQLLSFEASVTYDKYYKLRGEGQVTVTIPFGGGGYRRKLIAHPVKRNEIVPTSQLCKWRYNF